MQSTPYWSHDLLATRHDHTYRRIRSVLESEGLRCDRAGSNGEGIGFLSLANYRVVIHDQLGRDWRSTRLVRYISRYQHNIKIISLIFGSNFNVSARLFENVKIVIGPSFLANS